MKNNQFLYYILIIACIFSIFYFLEPIEPKNVNKMKKQFLSSGINLDYMDKNVLPQDDFYRFVNGSWIDSAI